MFLQFLDAVEKALENSGKKMNASTLAWLLIVDELVIRGILQHSQS